MQGVLLGIGGLVHTTAYVYNAADRVTQITYPSGRIVTYVRDSTGRITSVTTKQNATAAVVTLASGIVRQPHSNIVQTRARDRSSAARS